MGERVWTIVKTACHDTQMVDIGLLLGVGVANLHRVLLL